MVIVPWTKWKVRSRNDELEVKGASDGSCRQDSRSARPKVKEDEQR